MYIKAETLDDLMQDVLKELLSRPFDIETSRGKSSEIASVLLVLENPRARLSRTETKGKLFSALGELLWYLSKTNKLDFIFYYIRKYKEESEDGKTIYGAYGPRFFNWRKKRPSFLSWNGLNQVDTVIKLLKKRPFTRRAVIQLFDAEDIVEKHVEIPCTCTLQFMIRNGKLHLFTSMRSNDAFIGLPHDIFTFTMLQEIVAKTLKVELGSYSHAVGSLHLYENAKPSAQQYLNEGVQPVKGAAMPPMPDGDPWPVIDILLGAECKIRTGKKINISDLNLNPYWKDLVYLLQIHSLAKEDNYEEIKNIKKDMSNAIFYTYVEKKIANAKKQD